ncbi:hypothetical protein ACFY9N_00950 [Microbacterium sp. NPDC008134]|uniref:hypothetical protein n=1 Tax=Microbacterium sp. NPDC008134 TaxID=3364183 RepID=UPI0036E9064B
MSRSAENAVTKLDHRARAQPIDLTPVSARTAVGRYSGIAKSPRRTTPLWQSAGIVGLIALVAAGSLPLVADLLSVAS